MSEAQKPALTPAANTPTPPAQVPQQYAVEILVETVEGFHAMIIGQHLTPKDVMVWTRNAAAELAKQGFKPVRRDQQIHLEVPTAAAAEPAGKAKGKGRRGAGYTGEVYTECPECQGDIYDNRAKKARDTSWRGPWFKCKDEDDCGWVVFKNDGQPQE